MIFIRTTNGVLNADCIIRASLSLEYDGYAHVVHISEYVDASDPGSDYVLCKIEELEKIGITRDDLSHRPVSVTNP